MLRLFPREIHIWIGRRVTVKCSAKVFTIAISNIFQEILVFHIKPTVF